MPSDASDDASLETIADAIDSAVAGPKRVKGQTTEVEARSLDELLKAEDAVRRRKAARRRTGGVSFVKLIPPGTD